MESRLSIWHFHTTKEIVEMGVKSYQSECQDELTLLFMPFVSTKFRILCFSVQYSECYLIIQINSSVFSVESFPLGELLLLLPSSESGLNSQKLFLCSVQHNEHTNK